MPILTAVDLAELAPGVDQAQSGSISALLRRVQAWCESNLGAGRPLEAEQHREIIRVPGRLANWLNCPGCLCP